MQKSCLYRQKSWPYIDVQYPKLWAAQQQGDQGKVVRQIKPQNTSSVLWGQSTNISPECCDTSTAPNPALHTMSQAMPHICPFWGHHQGRNSRPSSVLLLLTALGPLLLLLGWWHLLSSRISAACAPRAASPRDPRGLTWNALQRHWVAIWALTHLFWEPFKELGWHIFKAYFLIPSFAICRVTHPGAGNTDQMAENHIYQGKNV